MHYCAIFVWCKPLPVLRSIYTSRLFWVRKYPNGDECSTAISTNLDVVIGHDVLF